MIFDGKVYREETPEEIAEREKWEQEHPPTPTMEERMAALEEENRILKEKAAALGRAALNGGMNHV